LFWYCLSNFSVLNIFEPDYISLETIPNFNYSKDIIEIFERLLKINLNDQIRDFVKDYIGIQRYSKFNGVLTFTEKTNGEKKDITKVRILEFVKSTQYFTKGGFTELLTKIDNNNIDI